MLADHLAGDPISYRAGPRRRAAYMCARQLLRPSAERLRRISYLFDATYLLDSEPGIDLPCGVERLPWKSDSILATYRQLLPNSEAINTGVDPKWDLPEKRSVAVSHAAREGFDVALLVDDDIWPIGLDHLREFESSGLEIAGRPPRRYPDISSIETVTGLHSHQFINGNFLLFRPSCSLSFFPKIYNDDWLFVMQSTAASRGLLQTRAPRQVAKHLNHKARAGEQEFGEVFVDGLAREVLPQQRTSLFWDKSYRDRFMALKRWHSSAIGNARPVIAAALERLESFCSRDLHQYDMLLADAQPMWRNAIIEKCSVK